MMGSITGHNVNLFNDNFTYNLMFMSPSQGRKRKLRIIFLLSVVAIVTRWKRGENILFLHMASKCDIISRLFKKCKIKCVNLLEKHQYLGTSMLYKLSFGQKIDLQISGNRIKLQPQEILLDNEPTETAHTANSRRGIGTIGSRHQTLPPFSHCSYVFASNSCKLNFEHCPMTIEIVVVLSTHVYRCVHIWVHEGQRTLSRVILYHSPPLEMMGSLPESETCEVYLFLVLFFQLIW